MGRVLDLEGTQQIISDHIYHVLGTLLNTEITTINNITNIPVLMKKALCLKWQILTITQINGFISIMITAIGTVRPSPVTGGRDSEQDDYSDPYHLGKQHIFKM